MVDGQVAGAVGLADEVRQESPEAVDALHELGIRVVMITGDAEPVARAVAAELGIDQVFAAVRPENKKEKVLELQRTGRRVAMVGEGVGADPNQRAQAPRRKPSSACHRTRGVVAHVRVIDRRAAASLSLERIEQHRAAGRVRVDGELVTDPYRPAPPAHVVITAPGSFREGDHSGPAPRGRSGELAANLYPRVLRSHRTWSWRTPVPLCWFVV
jgi:soluble P-type ATPase